MWQQLLKQMFDQAVRPYLDQIVRRAIETFLQKLAGGGSVPLGAQAMQGPDVEAAIRATCDELCK